MDLVICIAIVDSPVLGEVVLTIRTAALRLGLFVLVVDIVQGSSPSQGNTDFLSVIEPWLLGGSRGARLGRRCVGCAVV